MEPIPRRAVSLLAVRRGHIKVELEASLRLPRVGKAGSSTTAPCNGACTGTKPICDTDKNECVECTKSDDCKADATKPVCNTTKGACVACNGNNDCKDATASRCDTATNTCSACSVDDDCKQISGRGLCLTGDATLPNQCVQCTGKRYSACGQLEGTDLVCDSLAHTCTTDKKVKTASECQPCVSDAQCIAGQLCAKQMYGDKDAGNFCFWKQGDPTSGAPKDCPLDAPHPYVKVDKDLVSVDGEKATLCTLTVSTCKALNQFRTENCAPTGEWDDQYCGISPGLDSKCAAYGASQHRCTITCVTSDDCVSPTTCAPVSGVRICSFQ